MTKIIVPESPFTITIYNKNESESLFRLQNLGSSIIRHVDLQFPEIDQQETFRQANKGSVWVFSQGHFPTDMEPKQVIEFPIKWANNPESRTFVILKWMGESGDIKSHPDIINVKGY